MYINQSFEILFYRKLKKKNGKGLVPIYVRLTIDGLEGEISTGVFVNPDHWTQKPPTVTDQDPDYKKKNKVISDYTTDLDRNFKILLASEITVTPEKVFSTYRTPVRAVRVKEEAVKNQLFSDTLDLLIRDYVDYYEDQKKTYKANKTPDAVRVELLKGRKDALDQRLEKLTQSTNEIIDSKIWVKTLMLAINEHLLYFLRMCATDNRSFNTLEKMWVKKRRTVEFLQYRYKVLDIPLSELNGKHCLDFKDYNMTMRRVSNNQATKYIQAWKETINRTIEIGWLVVSPWNLVKLKYDDTDAEWMTPDQMHRFVVQECETESLEEARDVYVAMAFTGYAYADIEGLIPEFVMKGYDGKQWISKDRQKTDNDETLPLLPIVLELMEKYRNHPLCLRRGTCFPVPTNQQFNRLLKILCAGVGFKLKKGQGSHSARYYFANEVTYNNGVEVRTIQKSLGQKSERAVNHYIRPNKRNVGRSMQMVEDILFDGNGQLRGLNQPESQVAASGAKVISMTIVR